MSTGETMLSTVLDPPANPPAVPPAGGPRAAYEERLVARRAAVREWRDRERRGGIERLATFAATVVGCWAAFGPLGFPAVFAVVPFVLFLIVVGRHQRTVVALRTAERAVLDYKRAIARVDDQWRGHGPTGEGRLEVTHPYAGDLDLFGPGSLFQWLCAARTRMGEAALAERLLRGADADEIRARQAAVRELEPRLDLFEEFALLGRSAKDGIDPDQLLRWTRDPSRMPGTWFLVLSALTAIGVAIGLFLVAFTSVGGIPLAVALVVAGLLYRRIAHLIKCLLQELDFAQGELELLARTLRILEGQSFRSARLKQLHALPAAGPREPPLSRELSTLARRLGLYEQCVRNQFFAPPAFLLMGVVWVLHSVEKRRTALAARLPRSLQAVGEFEALLSLARNAFENPTHVEPEIVTDQGPLVEMIQAGHPLLPRTRCVRNDATLSADRRLLLVSGSNMSGKSTMLRTVGLNVVLALAGGRVRAEKMRLSPLRVGSAMRVQDSLLEGASHFFAEIRRLRTIVDLARTSGPPVLFLLDEILHGTNSHDRRRGAEGVIRSLLDARAFGMVTTHDLSLAEIVADLAPAAENVHFEDQWQDGRMTFDYRMRPGVVPRSNAVALMRLLGLDVPDEKT